MAVFNTDVLCCHLFYQKVAQSSVVSMKSAGSVKRKTKKATQSLGDSKKGGGSGKHKKKAGVMSKSKNAKIKDTP